MMNERIKKIMSGILEIPVTGIDDNASPEVIDRWDSLRHMQLILALEEEFRITFPDEKIPTLLSFESIREAIHDQIKVLREGEDKGT